MTSLRVLVTGASGLIGGRLLASLNTSDRVRVRAASRTPREGIAGVEGCVARIEEPDTLRAACRDMDVVINLASMGERAAAADPQAALRANGGGTLAWVTAAARVSRFVQVSTSKVYGDHLRDVVTENTPCRPRSHYAITHHVAEDYAASLHPNSVIFRLANGFGAATDPMVGWDVIVNEMCLQSVRDGRITIRSSGRAWRNFVPMDRILAALTAAMSDLPAGLYNLGSPNAMRLVDVANRVAGLATTTVGVTPAVSTGPESPAESNPPLDFRGDKLAAAGFNPPDTFDDEVVRTLSATRSFLGSRTTALR